VGHWLPRATQRFAPHSSILVSGVGLHDLSLDNSKGVVEGGSPVMTRVVSFGQSSAEYSRQSRSAVNQASTCAVLAMFEPTWSVLPTSTSSTREPRAAS
jgi:hypothetical protein